MAFTFCLYLLAFGIGAGFLISAFIYIGYFLFIVFNFIYQLPYLLWCGFTDATKKYTSLKDCSVRQNFKYANKLYKHWIFHKELDY